MRIRKTVVLVIFFVLAALPKFAFGQAYLYDTGNPSYGINIPIENGFINVTNGNLHMEFHLANNPQRGELALDEKLVYDSHFWMIGKYNRYHWWPDNLPRNAQLAMGWRFVTGGETGSLIDTSTGTAPQQCAYGGGTYGGDPGTYGKHLSDHLQIHVAGTRWNQASL